MLKILKRVRCKLYALYHLKLLPGYLLSWLYQAFVLPVFDYCDVVWTPTTVSLSKPLECLHSRFLQVPDCNSFVKVTLAERCLFHTAVQVFKVLYQLCPGYLKDWFVLAEAYTGHSGQNKCRLFVYQINTVLLLVRMDVELWSGIVCLLLYCCIVISCYIMLLVVVVLCMLCYCCIMFVISYWIMYVFVIVLHVCYHVLLAVFPSNSLNLALYACKLSITSNDKFVLTFTCLLSVHIAKSYN